MIRFLVHGQFRRIPVFSKNQLSIRAIRAVKRFADEEHCKPMEGQPASTHLTDSWKTWRDKMRIGHKRWQPRKRLLWQQMEEMRDLKAQYPHVWTIAKLGQRYGVSQAAVMKILKSKHVPSESVCAAQDERAKRQKAERKEFYKRK